MWATLPQAREHWPESADVSDGALTALLQAAYEECIEYAPTLDGREVEDGVTTSGSTEVTSETAAFTVRDIGRGISGTGIPSGATISRVVDSETVKLSVAATADGSSLTLLLADLEVPARYMLANVFQAREVYTAQQRGDASADVVGVGDFVVRARPLSAVVRQLLRPQGSSMLGFA